MNSEELRLIFNKQHFPKKPHTLPIFRNKQVAKRVAFPMGVYK